MAVSDNDDDRAAGEQLLTAYLADTDVACPRCGYNLRHLTGTRCPECGDEIQIQVGLVDPRMRPYIASIVAFGIGFGGSALFGIVAAFNAPEDWWGEWPGILMLSQLVVAGGCLAALLLRRRRFRTLSHKTQITLAVSAWLLVVALSTAIVLTFDN
jgi:DNA-directed RNA polymerase subunit RPC12/RpoP